MNTKLIVTFIILSLSLTSCHFKETNNSEQSSANSLSKDSDKVSGNWASLLNKSDSINRLIVLNKVSILSLNYDPYDENPESKISLSYNNGNVVAITYPIYSPTGKLKNYGKYYFDQEGNPILRVEPISNKDSSFISIGFNSHIEFEKIGRTTTKITRLSNEKECELIRQIDNFMYLFSAIANYKAGICIDSEFNYVVNTDSIILYKNSDTNSLRIRYLHSNEKIKYINRSQNTVDIGDEKTFFIKIKTQKEEIGWILFRGNNNIVDINTTD